MATSYDICTTISKVPIHITGISSVTSLIFSSYTTLLVPTVPNSISILYNKPLTYLSSSHRIVNEPTTFDIRMSVYHVGWYAGIGLSRAESRYSHFGPSDEYPWRKMALRKSGDKCRENGEPGWIEQAISTPVSKHPKSHLQASHVEARRPRKWKCLCT